MKKLIEIGFIAAIKNLEEQKENLYKAIDDEQRKNIE